MKSLFKWAWRLLVLLLVLLVAALLLKDQIVTSIAEKRLRQQTGVDLRIGRLELGIFRPVARVEKLVIFNPPEFGGGPLMDLTELHVDYDRAAMRAGKLKLKLLRFNLGELNVVVDRDGRTNLDGVRRALEGLRQGRTPEFESPMEFVGIDMLNLTLGKATWTDLRVTGEPRSRDLGIRNEVLQDIKTPQQLVAKLMPVLLRAGLAFLGGATPGNGTNRPAPPITPFQSK